MTDRIPSQKNLGASEVAAVLGLAPTNWDSGWDVWARKTARVDGKPDNDQMAAGRLLEPAVLTLAERQLGPLERAPETLVIDNSPIVCHLDAQTKAAKEPVEAKTGGLYGPLVGNWGEDGTDDIPDYYFVQLLMYVHAKKADIGHLAALLGGRGFHTYVCRADPGLADELVNRVGAWWDRHVVGDTPPQDSLPTPETLSRIRRVEATVDMPAEAVVLADAYEAARISRLETEKRKERHWTALAALLGDAMVGRLPDGRVVGYSEYTAKTLDHSALKRLRPDVAKEFTKAALRRRKFIKREK